MPLIEFTDKGLFCRQGDFYIDPWKPVNKAIITHAHSDHARPGSKHYLCHHLTKPLLQLRLGDNSYESLGWNEPVFINGVKVTLHPSGHIIGAAQIRVEYEGNVWVASGDYKTEDDGISGGFEPVKCHTFITESTFGLPIYKWKKQPEIFDDIKQWIAQNNAEKKNQCTDRLQSWKGSAGIAAHRGNGIACIYTWCGLQCTPGTGQQWLEITGSTTCATGHTQGTHGRQYRVGASQCRWNTLDEKILSL
ncbi:MAG: hypothetical protein WKI04_11470 [Ferruginibacter sp.]